MKMENDSIVANRSFLESLLGDLKERVHSLEQFDRDYEINAYCDDLVSDVILTIESAVKNLNDFQQELLQEIHAYRSELLKSPYSTMKSRNEISAFYADLAQINMDLASLQAELDEFSKKCAAHLDAEANVSDEVVTQAKAKAEALTVKAKALDRRMRNQAFGKKFMKLTINRVVGLDKRRLAKLECVNQEPGRGTDADVLEPKMKFERVLDLDYVNAGGVHFLPNGDLITYLGGLKIWNHKTGQMKMTLSAPGVPGCPFSVSYLQHDYFAVGTSLGFITIWNMTDYKLVRVLNRKQKWTYSTARPINSFLVLDNGYLASCCLAGVIKIWNPYLHEDKCHVLTIDTKPKEGFVCANLGKLSNGFLVSCCFAGVIKVWDPKDGCLMQEMEISYAGHFLRVLSNDDVVIASIRRHCKCFNLVEKKMVHNFSCIDGENIKFLTLMRNGLLLSYNCVGSSKDSANRSTNIKVWDAESGRLIQTIKVPGRHINFVSLTHDEKVLAIADWYSSVSVWSLEF